MIDILLCANVAVCALWCTLVLTRGAPRILLLVGGFHFLLFVAKPIASAFPDYVPGLIDFRHYSAAYTTYLGCGVLFLSVVSAMYFTALPKVLRASAGASEGNGGETQSIGVAITTFIILIALSMVANAIRFDDPLYFIRLQSSFDAMMSNTDRWYLNTIAECPIVGVAVIAARLRPQRPVGLRIFYAAMTMVVFIVLTRPSTRTGAMAMMMAILIQYFAGRKVGVVRGGLMAIGLLSSYVVLSFLRLGRDLSLISSALVGLVSVVFNGFIPADLGVMLLSMRAPGSFLWFKYLGGAINPLIIVPSGLVPFDKPRADLEAQMTSIYFGPLFDIKLFTEGSTLTFTAPASAYLNLAWVGVAAMALLYALLLLAGTRMSQISRPSLRIVGTYWLIGLGAGYRYSVEGAVVSAYSLAVLVAMYFSIEWGISRVLAVLRDSIIQVE